MSDINTFEDLEVWKRGCQLAVDVYVANHASRGFGMKDQMQRAAVSIPSNIAEGCERDSTPDFIKFLRYSKGSCSELRNQLLISERVCRKLDLPPLDHPREIIAETREISKMLQGLINSLKRRSNS